MFVATVAVFGKHGLVFLCTLHSNPQRVQPELNGWHAFRPRLEVSGASFKASSRTMGPDCLVRPLMWYAQAANCSFFVLLGSSSLHAWSVWQKGVEEQEKGVANSA